MRTQCVVLFALVLLCQSAEQAAGEAVATLVDPDYNLGETAKLEDKPGPGALVAEMAAANPDEEVTPTKLEAPPAQGPAALAAQMAAITNADGSNPISGEIPETGKEVIIGKVPSYNANAILAAKEAQQQQAAAALKAGNIKWRTIPSFQFKEDGSEQTGLSQQECQDRCKSDMDCVSYSYNSADQLCVESKSCIQYDMEYDFYAKKSNAKGGVSPFRKLGNLKYMVKGANDKTTTPLPGVTPTVCAHTCSEADTCKSYAFRARDNMCLYSTQDLGYSEDWTYAEKSGAAAELATKQKEAVVKDQASQKKLPGDDGAEAAKGKAMDEALKQADRAGLSPEQAAAIAAKNADKGDNTDVRAILLDNIQAKTVELNREQEARLEASSIEAKRAQAETKAENELRTKGQKIYDADVSFTRSKLQNTMEEAEKAGWKASEKGAKSESSESERTSKNNQADKAEALRAKTATSITNTAQKILEAENDMTAVTQREKLMNEAMDHFKGLNTDAKNKVKFQKSEQARASTMLVQSKNTNTLDDLKKKYDAAVQEMADCDQLIGEKNTVISDANGQIPTLNADKISAGQAVATAEGVVTRTQEEIDRQTDSRIKITLGTRKKHEQANEGTAKTAFRNVDSKLTELTTKVTAAQRFISDEQTKKDTAQGKKMVATSQTDAEQQRLTTLETDGNNLLGTSRFKANQALSQEFSVKQDIAAEFRKNIDFQEGDEKKKLKLEDLQAKAKELEESQKEQAMEEKVKVAVKFQEHAQKKQKRVDDTVKEAEEDEARSVKLIADGRFAEAAATSVAEKVAATTKISNGQSLKVSSEQKVNNLGPARQAAKEAKESADDKLQALKDSFKDDEAGYKKAMARFNTASAAMQSATEGGEVKVAKEEEKEEDRLQVERAALYGLNFNPGDIHDNSVNNGGNWQSQGPDEVGMQAKPEEELRNKVVAKRTADMAKGTVGGVLSPTAELQHKKQLVTKIHTQAAVERETKHQIQLLEAGSEAGVKQLQSEHEKGKEADSKEMRTKQGTLDQGNAFAALTPAQELAKTQAEASIAKSSEQSAKSAQLAQQHSKKSEHGCNTGSLADKEQCTKSKAVEYDGLEKSAKQSAVDLKAQLKTEEGTNKMNEHQSKEGPMKKEGLNEKTIKEKMNKEAEQKRTMTEADTKEMTKKTKDKEKDEKAQTVRDAQAKEESEKAMAKMSSEERTKYSAQQEKINKSKELETKTGERDTKEMGVKSEKTSKSESELGEKSGESIQKTGQANMDEASQKDSHEKSQKATVEMQDKSDATVAQTKERQAKAANEGQVKTNQRAQAGLLAGDEHANKQSDNDNMEASSKSKAKLDAQAAQNVQENSSKGKTSELQTKEASTKAGANEQQNKISMTSGMSAGSNAGSRL